MTDVKIAIDPARAKSISSDAKAERKLAKKLRKRETKKIRHQVIESVARVTKSGKAATTHKNGFSSSKHTEEYAAQVRSSIAGIKPSKRIAMSLACPSAGYAPRYADEYNSSKTAVGCPYARLNTVAEDTDGSFAASDTLFAAVFRSPCRAAVVTTRAGSGDSIYLAYGSDDISVGQRFGPATSWTIKLQTDGESSAIGLKYFRTVSAVQPHGPIFCCGTPNGLADESGDRWFWFDEGSSCKIDFSTATVVVGGLEFEVLSWTPAGVELFNAVSHDSGPTIQNVELIAATDPSGYYCVRFTCIGDVGPSFVVDKFQINIANGTCCMGHRTMPDFDKWFASAQGIRVMAGSLMLTNNTAMNFRGGQIAAYQAPVDAYWWEFAATNSAVGSQQGAGQIDADNGMYTWLSPADESDYFMRNEYESFGGYLFDTHYSMIPNSQYLVMQFYSEDSSTVKFNGLWTFNFAIEFLTGDVSREVDEPHDDKQDWDAAIEMLKRMPKYAENPMHWGDLLRSISTGAKSVLNFGVKNAPLLLKGAEFISQLAGAI